jgi:hypothetical protein
MVRASCLLMWTDCTLVGISVCGCSGTNATGCQDDSMRMSSRCQGIRQLPAVEPQRTARATRRPNYRDVPRFP